MRVAAARSCSASAALFGLLKLYGPRVRNRRHAHLARRQRAGKLACRRPSRQRIRGYGLEIAPEPSHACRVGRICGSPDVEPLEMRAARIQVPGALDDRQPAFVENVPEAAKPGMQPEGAAARVGPDLQHRACRDGDRRSPAVIERIQIGHDGVQRVVAAAQVEHDQAARPRALRARDVREKRRRGEADGKRRHASPHEISPCQWHGQLRGYGLRGRSVQLGCRPCRSL